MDRELRAVVETIMSKQKSSLSGNSQQQVEARERIAAHWDRYQSHPLFDHDGECKAIGTLERPKSIGEVKEAVA